MASARLSSLRSVNHNLLPILLALLRERSVSRAALAMGLSQPAMSKALAQLREILKDPLLVRGHREFVLTERGKDLIEPVAAICRDLEAIWQTEIFDPEYSHREFVIAGSDYCAMLIIPMLVQALRDVAPHIRLRFVDMVPEMMLDDRANIDFVMAPTYAIPQAIIAANCFVRLFDDDFVTVVANSHPLAKRTSVTREDLSNEVRVSFGHEEPLVPGQVSKSAGFLAAQDHTMAVVQQFMTLPMLVILTDMVSTIPRRLAEIAREVLPLKIIENVTEPWEVEMSLAWNKRHDDDQAHRWFRDFLVKYAGKDGR